LLVGLATVATAASPKPAPTPSVVFEEMNEEAGGNLEVYWDEDTGIPRFLVGEIAPEAASIAGYDNQPHTAEARARAYFRQHADLYQMEDPDTELVLQKLNQDDLGMAHVHFRQEFEGVPVWGAVMAVHLQADGQVVAVNGEYVPHIALDVSPALSFDQALDLARSDLGDEMAELLTDYSQLTIYTDTPTPTLTWQVTLISEAVPGNWIYFIDAQSGAVVYRLNQVGLVKTHPINNSDDVSTSAGKSIATYDANYTRTLPATPTCTNSDGTCPGGDADEKAAHRHMSIVYDYFKETFGLDSYDGKGSTMIAAVHFDVKDARWYIDGSGRDYTIFGDGDGVEWSSLAQALDLVAHEWIHGINWHQAGLIYSEQPGIIQESYADVFAVLVDYYHDPDNANWLMFEDVWTPGVAGDASRDLSNPSNGAAGLFDPNKPLQGGQPDHMDLYVDLANFGEVDRGGIHVNNGILNKAAYLIAEGGTFHGVVVTGIGQDNLAQIYFRALAQYLTPTSNFMDLRSAVRQACTDLFGSGHAHCASVQNGFAAVGLGVPASFSQVYLPLIMNPSPGGNEPLCSPVGIYGQITENGAPVSEFSIDLRKCTSIYLNPSCSIVRTTSTDSNGCYSFGDADTLTETIDGIYPNSIYSVIYINPLSTYNNRLAYGVGDQIYLYKTGDNVPGGNIELKDVTYIFPLGGSTVTFPVTFSWNIRNPSEMYQWKLYSSNWELLYRAYGDTEVGGNSYTLTGPPPGVTLNPSDTYLWAVELYTNDSLGAPYYGRYIKFSDTTATTLPDPAPGERVPPDLLHLELEEVDLPQ
ncbi:MAG: peptidase M4 family protein, partial [Anaerolineae bacterium]|nr:peptidase M4 family protein [Anaerolineae bacterium]